LAGDPISKIYDPYIGLRGQGRKCCGCETTLMYRWRLIGSPIAWSHFVDPMWIHCVGPGQTEWITTTYTLDANSGYMLEGEFEGLVDVLPNLRGSMWVKGHYDQVEGQGNLTSTVTASTIAGVIPGSATIDNSKIYKSYFMLGLGLETYF